MFGINWRHKGSRAAALQQAFIRCPHCSTDRPNFSVVELSNQWHDQETGELRSAVTGWEVSCKNCGTRYCVHRHGVFVPHPESLPFIPGPEMPATEQPPPEAKRKEQKTTSETPLSLVETERDWRARELPTPKQRPPFAP